MSNTLQHTQDNLLWLVDELEEYKKDLRGGFAQLLMPLMEELGIQKIEWTQYTPYFNDGDECFFSRHTVYADDKYNREVDQLLNTLPNSFYMDVFGDHALIQIQADGSVAVNTEEEHD